MELTGFIGNEPLKRSLAGMERPPHAVIISGAKGSGRHTLAKLLAQALVCSGEGQTPCGACPNCRRVREGIHPDVMDLSAFVPAEELEKDVRVNTIRDIRTDAQIRPNQAGRKVYLLDQNINLAAQNAMLKLLEEGPSYAAFLILTENSDALLETVRSRCALLHTSPVTPAQTMEYLSRRYPEREQNAVSQAAHACQGILGRGIELLEGEEKESDIEALNASWLNAILHRSEWELMQCAAAVQTKKLSRDSAVSLYLALGRSFRNALVEPNSSPQTQQMAQTLPAETLLQLYDLSQQAREQCKCNVAPAHSAGWLAVKLYAQLSGLTRSF
jgi:DNA polymerase-3 subunit delta'